MLGLDQFSFVAVWRPGILLVTIAVIALYFWAIGPGRSRFHDAKAVPTLKRVSFVSGALLLYIGLGGPLNLLGHLTFTGHMSSMAISYLAAPPLLLYGLPDWMLRPLTTDRWFQFFNRRFLRPIFTVFFFNMLFSFYHFPAIHDFIMTHYTIHTLYYLLLLIASLMMWWPIVAPLPELASLTHVKKMGYIFLSGVLLTPACALIIFAPNPMFQTFSDPMIWAKAMAYCIPGGGATDILAQFNGPQQFSIMDPRHDQQLGGVIMKLFQELVYSTMLYYIFTQWYQHEKGDDDERNEDAEQLASAQPHRI